MDMTLSPIHQDDLPAVGQFLHHQLAKRISPQAWVASLTQGWAAEQPNYGMQLHDAGQLVGVFCAIYSDQLIDGRVERFCNPHSWCVMDSHRHASLSLVLPLIKQRGYHFTMFTPNLKVAQVFLGLRFKLLDDRLVYTANLPAPWAMRGGAFVEAHTCHVAQRLHGAALQEFNAHRQIPWLRFAAFGTASESCLVIYKPARWKKLRCAGILHVSDPDLMASHGHLLRHHLLTRCAMPVSRVEARFLSQVPVLSHMARRGQPKLVSSRSLPDSKIRDVYSELMSLDI